MKKERTQITQELCEHVRILLAGGANLNKAAEITGTGHATISRIKAAGFSAEVYRQNQLKQKEKKKPELEQTVNHEELAGQMKMDLQPTEEPKEMSDQTKLMRFQARMTDDIRTTMMECTTLLGVRMDKIYDMMGQILRAIRKE
jgi:hypothetical protein